MEKNRTLYHRLFRLWVISIAFCFVAATAVTYFFSEKKAFSAPLFVAIFFLPLAIQGVSGLAGGYSAGHWWNTIYRGTPAFLVNVAWLLCYAIAVVVSCVNQ
jgi:hypothetical protein